MFRRSLQILLAATLLALAAIVGYASLRIDGPQETLARAEQFVAQQEFARAIAELDLCERAPSLQQDTALRERLWRLRLRANTTIGNHRGALRDVENLLRQEDADPGLQLDRVRLLTASGDGARALQLVRTFVADHPEDAAGFQVAAETCAALYEPEYARLENAIVVDLGAAHAAAARAAMARLVFPPDGDAVVAATVTTLGRQYSVDTRLAARWPVVLRELQELRTQVQEGLAWSRRCLELPGTPTTAAVAWTEALDAGGRYDDMLAAAEIQRRRADTDAASATGLVVARSLLRRQANAACVAAVARWLPSQRLADRVAERRLGEAAQDLLMARLIAAWRLGDTAGLLASLTDTQALRQAGQPAPLVQFTTAGLLHYRGQLDTGANLDTRNAEANLRIVVREQLDVPLQPDWPDLLGMLMPLYVDLLQKLGNPEADVLTAFAAWQKARPDQLAPRLAFARHLLGRGKVVAAQSVLADGSATDPTDAELFALRLQAARADTSQAGQDGAALVAQCIKRQSATPEVAQPIGYLLCAEAALQQQIWVIARESARLATDAFPQQTAPRLLEIEAMLRGGELAVAAQRSRRLLDLFPDDAAVLRAALRANAAAGQPTADLLARALPRCAADDLLRVAILRQALADDPLGAAAFAGRAAQAPASSSELRLLAAQALALAGRAADARLLLDGVLAESDALPADARLDLARALAAWIVAEAELRDDAALAPEVVHRLARTDLRDAAVAPLWLQTADRIAATHPRTSHELAVRGLDLAEPSVRNGAAFARAGRLARRLQLERLAEEQLLAAIAFPDGRDAAEDLARLLLAQGRSERALQVYRLVEPATDAALAARCGERDRALRLARDAAAADPADLLAQATLAALGEPSRVEWRAGDVPTTELRLDLLSLLQEPDLATRALALAESLVTAQPESVTNILLLARAHRLAGGAATAAALHAAVAERAPGPFVWREIAVAAATPGYEPTPALQQRLIDAMVGGAVDGSPATIRFGMQQFVAACERDGRRDLATATRENRWALWPTLTVTTAADVAAVAAMTNTSSARYVLEQALPELTGPAHTLALTRLYELYDRLVTTLGRDATDVYETALRHVASEGPHGCIVEFLLTHGATFPALQPDATWTRRLLLAQIELAGTGRDPGDRLLASVHRLHTLQGPAATLRDVEAALARHPTCLPLWRARALALVDLQQVERGIGDLRAVLDHADAPDETLAFLRLAGSHGTVHDDDRARLESLPAERLASADATFVRGLLALRQGRADEAVPLLTGAPPLPDGLHLFMLALAHLQSRSLDGGERARAVFEQLAADYPSSSLARHAGSFATQLTPR